MYSLYKTNTEQPICYEIHSREFHKMNLKFKKQYVDSCLTCNKSNIIYLAQSVLRNSNAMSFQTACNSNCTLYRRGDRAVTKPL